MIIELLLVMGIVPSIQKLPIQWSKGEMIAQNLLHQTLKYQH